MVTTTPAGSLGRHLPVAFRNTLAFENQKHPLANARKGPRGDDENNSHYASEALQLNPITELDSQSKLGFQKNFNIYRRRLCTGTYTLGPHKTITHSRVKLHSRFSLAPPVILYPGPVESEIPLATVDGVCPNWHIKLFDPCSGQVSLDELLLEESRYAGPSFSTFKFSIEVGERGIRELFEWRNSDCWELVRLDTKLSNARLDPEKPTEGETASNEDEIVALMLHMWGKPSKQQAEFRFIGSGASGRLGEKWAVMAVASALQVFRQVRRHSLRPPSNRSPNDMNSGPRPWMYEARN